MGRRSNSTEFWQALADALTADFHRGAFTDGIVAALEKAGELLACHFPRRPDDRNELSDRVLNRPRII